jgi:hypothetical protein
MFGKHRREVGLSQKENYQENGTAALIRQTTIFAFAGGYVDADRALH